MDKMQKLFEKMVNITFQAQAQGEIGMVTGERIDKVVAEYEKYCNQEERKKLIAEAKVKVEELEEYLDEIEKYN